MRKFLDTTGQREHHEYELYLAVENIDHSGTKARHPQTNGICERFHRTIQEEFYATAFRKKLYTSLEELQADLDEWLGEYNRTRPHSGKYCYGKTPDADLLGFAFPGAGENARRAVESSAGAGAEP